MSENISEDLSFRFSLPDEFAVRGCRFEDGVPVLLFTPSPKMPTITEADWAAVLRSVFCNNARPGFFFSTITNPGHPHWGKWLKNYFPEFTRGTELGDLLFRADWIMKCLMVGARSNKDMTNFKAWEKTSRLECFASKLDFFQDENPTSPSVFMSCSSVEVSETEDELWFVGEPQMEIDDGSCKAYSKYITAIYDSIAYYDEPLLLKVREVPKLILLAEWLRDKNVRISESWMKKKTKPRPDKYLDQGRRTYPSVRKLEPMPVLKLLAQNSKQRSTPLPQISYKLPEIGISDVEVVDDRLIKWKETSKEMLQWPFAMELNVTRKVTASFDDLDRVHEGVDPNCNMPISYIYVPEMGNLVPQKPSAVSSWSELDHLVVSTPCVVQPALIGFTKPTEGGGVNMGNVAKRPSTAPSVKQEIKGGRRQSPVVKQEQFRLYPDDTSTLGVAATKGRNKQQTKEAPKSVIPKPEPEFKVPTRSVKAETELHKRNKAVRSYSGSSPAYGTLNSFSGEMDLYSPEGEPMYHSGLLHQRQEVEVSYPSSPLSSSTISSGYGTPVPFNNGPADESGRRDLQLAWDPSSIDRGFSLPSSPGDSGFGGSTPSETESNFSQD